MTILDWIIPASVLAARVVIAAAVLACCGAATSAFADTLIVQGSTTFNRRLMEPYQATIEAASGHQLTVIPNKSTPGLIGLLEGRAHMAMISAPLHSEIELLRKSVPGLSYKRLRAFEIASTRIAIAVHSSNPVRSANLDQMAQVLRGDIDNWSKIGGPDLPIRIVLVGGGGGVTVAVESELLNGQAVPARDVIFVKTPVQLVQVVGQELGALGFAQLALVRERNISELITDKPLQQHLSLVTLGEPTPAMLSVIDAARNIAAKVM
jgi:phosphate transport system substrate-binding protein